jgi:hypothetical protein
MWLPYLAVAKRLGVTQAEQIRADWPEETAPKTKFQTSSNLKFLWCLILEVWSFLAF